MISCDGGYSRQDVDVDVDDGRDLHLGSGRLEREGEGPAGRADVPLWICSTREVDECDVSSTLLRGIFFFSSIARIYVVISASPLFILLLLLCFL